VISFLFLFAHAFSYSICTIFLVFLHHVSSPLFSWLAAWVWSSYYSRVGKFSTARGFLYFLRIKYYIKRIRCYIYVTILKPISNEIQHSEYCIIRSLELTQLIFTHKNKKRVAFFIYISSYWSSRYGLYSGISYMISLFHMR